MGLGNHQEKKLKDKGKNIMRKSRRRKKGPAEEGRNAEVRSQKSGKK